MSLEEVLDRTISTLDKAIKMKKEYEHFRFIVGETLVSVSKWDISAEDGIEKIREALLELDMNTRN